ncbi:hypothetical protein QO179_23735 [Bacillus stercoris]|nr:hypothetical protein [Bacillus stercoris]
MEHLLSRVNNIYREINDLEKGTYVFVFRNESLRFVRDKPSYIFTDQEINKNKIASLLLYKKENLRDMKKDKISKRC